MIIIYDRLLATIDLPVTLESEDAAEVLVRRDHVSFLAPRDTDMAGIRGTGQAEGSVVLVSYGANDISVYDGW